ncbi:MAG: gliding motility-associated C-terminal domain-containing protein, partial [Flavobacteriales bacterium]
GYIYDLSSSCGDTVYIAAQVVVHASPSPPTVFDDQSICEGDTAYLNAIGTGINWYDQDANLVASDKNNLIITGLMQGNHWFYATQTDPNTGCESMEADSALITVIGNNDIDAGRGDTICPGSKVQLFATGGGTYHWFPEELVSDPFIPDPLAFPEKDTWFYVEITIDSGCTFIDSVFIAMDKGDNCWHVFNAFSPNGDGKNDFWFIKGIEQHPDNWVEIYNRWGTLVNKFDHYDNLKTVWDGTNFEGAELPESTYYFILHVSDGRHSGWVQIIR